MTPIEKEIRAALTDLNIRMIYLGWVHDATAFSLTCCDQPEDRMYHAADQTWWRRDGIRWIAADPPPGWEKKERTDE